jgi:hypothetical protein
MDLRKEYCELNGHSKFNKYNINDYTKFLEQKITEQNQALQLQQTGVIKSVCDCKPIEYYIDEIRYFKCRFCGKVMK